jgi:fructokinase
VTRGSQGAWLLTNNNFISSEPVKVNKMVDTVGAGDAFSAVCLLGIVKQWSAEICLQRASAFASAICEQRGATMYEQDIYNDFIKRWQL